MLRIVPSELSAKRQHLCNRANARRVADCLLANGAEQVSIVRTGHPLQPIRVVPGIVDGAEVELEMRSA